MCPFDFRSWCEEYEDLVRKLIYHTTLVTVVSQTDRPNLVCNGCVLDLFVVSLC